MCERIPAKVDDQPEIHMIVELEMGDIADADEVLPDAASERQRDAR